MITDSAKFFDIHLGKFEDEHAIYLFSVYNFHRNFAVANGFMSSLSYPQIVHGVNLQTTTVAAQPTDTTVNSRTDFYNDMKMNLAHCQPDDGAVRSLLRPTTTTNEQTTLGLGNFKENLFA